MKLSKLYSNRPFHNVTFITKKGGLNAIIADSQKEDGTGNQHCVGKTKLAELIDFMLLKGVDKSFFFYKDSAKEKFAGYEFYLEILLNDGRYLTLKRSVDNHSKISFKLNEISKDEYVLFEQFDETLGLDKAKNKLNDLLSFDFCKYNDENYRRLVNYSLRTQGDYEPKMNTIFQLRKFTKNKDKDWKPLLFSLLGFDGKLLKQKYELEESIKEDNNSIKNQEKSFGIKTEEKDSLIGKIQTIEIERDKLSKELDNFNFYQKDKETISTLVGEIEYEIALLNTQLYQLEYEIQKLNDSIRNEFSFDLKKVKNIFKEVEIYFPQQLSKSYEQLVEFNQLITKERNSQIRQTLDEKKQQEREINKRLSELNSRKKAFRDVIQDTSLFKKYAVYQKKLVEVERELTRFQAQLEEIDKIEKKKSEIQEKQKGDLQDIKDKLKEILDNTASCALYMSIRRSFSEIAKEILNDNAIIKIVPNNTFNIDFRPEFPNSAKSDGATYYKILCVAFDLAILINYRDKSHFRFVYHDDVISGDDNGVKYRLIELCREICERHDIQYIFSAIKDNLPPDIELGNNIVLELNDRNDEGKLFKMSF
ncbi:DUF2326 domain-containing protein [Runella zeae]|uniref:DUF2326 domain-containing protein n=1 Tax=Runella zeae TaxID=94255 RepID=UPI0023554FBB|nr:DUF2326 domain-containing protein [Runella zeae]